MKELKEVEKELLKMLAKSKISTTAASSYRDGISGYVKGLKAALEIIKIKLQKHE